jgi:7,8-dihydroneopterin aldolase/epimerase/oxygenase
MDKLFLRQLAVPALIGVYEHEKIVPQTIYLDIETAINVNLAAAADQITATVDYSAIYHDLCEYIATTRFQLLETLAVNLCERLMKKFALTWLRLTVMKKPSDMPLAAGAGIIIERKL